jgi:hypothetical protein
MMIYCHEHDIFFDSDFYEMCPLHEDDLSKIVIEDEEENERIIGYRDRPNS